MTTLIIVDDEKSIRNQLCDIFEWLSEEIVVIGTFKNVDETIDFLKVNSVDIIITDIVMKNSDGLDIARYVYENNLATKVIMISAHTDFQYAQTAIRYNVFDYLSKPINIEELRKTVNSAAEFVKEKENSMFEMVKKYMTELLETDFDIPVNLYKRNFMSALVYITPLCTAACDYEYENLITNILSFCSGKIKYSLLKADDKTVYIFAFSSDTDKNMFRKEIENDCKYIKSNIKEILGTDAEVSVSDVSSSLIDLVGIFLKSNSSNGSFTNNFIVNSISERIRTDDIKESAYMVGSLIDAIDSDKNAVDFARQLFAALEIKSDTSFDNMSRKQLKEYVTDTITKFKTTGDAPIDKALAYINENYMNHISRSGVANFMNMNPAYFSRFFYSKTKIKFSDYLLMIRISKAKELLETSSFSIDAISKLVGYSNVQYFYKLFKSNVGCTPAEYIKNLKNGEQNE